MSKVILTADIPDQLMGEFVQLLRDYDASHEGCHLVISLQTEQSTSEVEAMLDSLDPPFAFRAKTARLSQDMDSLRAELDEHERSFDLRWKAEMRAIKRWRAAGPGRELTLPDHADLCVWLLEQLEAKGT